MKKEDKDLLLKDLCARLPYGVICNVDTFGIYKLQDIGINYATLQSIDDKKKVCTTDTEFIHAYLRLMSSMTEEERNKATSLFGHNKCINEYGDVHCYNNGESVVDLCDTNSYYDWLNQHHFDYRGLIEKGLALKAPEGMYN